MFMVGVNPERGKNNLHSPLIKIDRLLSIVSHSDARKENIYSCHFTG